MAQYDLQYSHLLPSQLLINSHYQPGTPSIPQYANFGQNPSSSAAYSPTPDYNSLTAAYSMPQYYGAPSAQLEAMESSVASRTVYIGNIPPEVTAEELLNHVRSGVVESLKLVPEKNCAFISFLNAAAASHFYSDAILKKLSLNSQDVKIGWGKSTPVSAQVSLAVAQDGASRNVYLGNLPDEITEDDIRTELTKFGPIDTIKLVKEKNIGFVHFLSINTAIKVVQQLPFESQWAHRKVFYGKDRCAYISKTQQQNAAQYLGIAPGYEHLIVSADRDLISSALAQQSAAAVAVATAAGGANNVGNRTVYLGSVHPETTIEEICNVVRGGLLHNIRYIPEKHICFVTFVDPTAAAQFFAIANLQGLAIHNRRLKIGWGKHSGPLPNAIAMAVTAGASRNVYIGNIGDNWPESKLRHDFAEFGDIEQINFLAEKSCAFVNFTNIANAIKAIERIKQKDEYKKFKINFGKDRCGNPSRQLQQPLAQLQQQQQQGLQQQQLLQQQLLMQQQPSYVPMMDIMGSGAEGAPGMVTNGHFMISSLDPPDEADEDEAENDEYHDKPSYSTHPSAASTTLTIPESIEEELSVDSDGAAKRSDTPSSTSTERPKKVEETFALDDDAAAAVAAAAARTFGIVSASEKTKDSGAVSSIVV